MRNGLARSTVCVGLSRRGLNLEYHVAYFDLNCTPYPDNDIGIRDWKSVGIFYHRAQDLIYFRYFPSYLRDFLRRTAYSGPHDVHLLLQSNPRNIPINSVSIGIRVSLQETLVLAL